MMKTRRIMNVEPKIMYIDLTSVDYRYVELPTDIVVTRLEYIAQLNRLTKYVISGANTIIELPYDRTSSEYWDLCKIELNSAFEVPKAFKIEKLLGPTPPRNVVAEYDGHINISWSAPEQAGSKPIRSYVICMSDNTAKYYRKIQEVPASQTSVQITPPNPGSEYLVFVQAISEVGYSHRSNEANPAPPSQLIPDGPLEIRNTPAIVQMTYMEVY